MKVKIAVIFVVILILKEGDSSEYRCFERNKDDPQFIQRIDGLRDMDIPNQNPPSRSLTIVSMADVLSNQLMGWVVHILLTEKLNYEGIYHEVVEDASRTLFNNMPRKELSISTELWHSAESVNNLIDYNAKTLPSTLLQGRFSLYLPKRLVENSKQKMLRANCASPLHQHPIEAHFNSTKLHSEIKSIFDKLVNPQKFNQSSEAKLTSLNQPSVGLKMFNKYAVYRSKGCVDAVEGCLVIVSSTYNLYGDCLVKMVKNTNSKVVIFWIGHHHLHQFVMDKSTDEENVLYFGWNLDLLHNSGLFVSMEMDQWSCLDGDCTWGYHMIYKTITKDLRYSAFSIEKVMNDFKFSNHHITSMLAHKEHDWWKDGATREVACNWLKENTDLCKKWTKDAPKKEPINLMMFYASEKTLSTLLVSTMAVKSINSNHSILPNHQLVLNSYEPNALSEAKHYRILVNYLTSGQVKGAFGSTQNSFARLPKWMESFKTVYFSQSPSIDLDDEHTETFYSMTPDLQERFVAIGSLFEEFGWSRASFIVEGKSTLYKMLAMHMKNMLKSRKMQVIEEIKLQPKFSQHSLFKELDEIKDVRSNIIILLISQPILNEVLCVLHHKGMTPKNDYVYIYVTGLSAGVIKRLVKGNDNSAGRAKALFNNNNYNNKDNKADNESLYEDIPESSLKNEKKLKFECNSDVRKGLLDKMITIEERYFSKNIETLVLNKSIKSWYEEIIKYLAPQNQKRDLKMEDLSPEDLNLFDSILAYSFALHHYFTNHPSNSLSNLTTQKAMVSLKASMATVNFSGLSGHVEFSNMSRIARTVIHQYNLTKATEVGLYSPKEERLELFSKFKWATADGRAPPDIKALVEKESCNLQVISDIFKVSCNHAIVIFSIFIAILIMVPFFFIIFIFKKRFDDKNVVDNVISQSLREKWGLKRNDIVINRILGHGEFGTVYGGEVVGAAGGGSMVPVAVKILKSGARDEDKVAFFAEADLMKDFEHENIMKLIGVCSVDEPSMVVMEFMMYGDLRTYLLSRRHLVSNRGGTVELGPASITKMALDVAKGLQYLIKVFCVHRDLACRNCLVHESGLVKISDFGLTHKMFEEFYARCVSDSKFPIRWMAPECLKHGVFSFASDIWSYGILLYELFTFGTIPYHDLTNEEVVSYIKEGRTIKLPSSCPENLASMLKRCWSYEAENRPSIEMILDDLTYNPLLLKPCLDLPRPHFDPKESSTTGGNINLKGLLFPRQWVSRLSSSSTTGLLVRNRNPFGRGGSMQSPQKSPDVRQKTSEERYFSYPSNIASKEGERVVESKSEAGLQVGGGGSSGGGGAGGSSSGGGGEPEKKSLLKGFDARKAFARSMSSDHKTSRFKPFRKTPKKTSPDLSIEINPLTSKSHQQ